MCHAVAAGSQEVTVVFWFISVNIVYNRSVTPSSKINIVSYHRTLSVFTCYLQPLKIIYKNDAIPCYFISFLRTNKMYKEINCITDK
jgi:hypothetical protein